MLNNIKSVFYKLIFNKRLNNSIFSNGSFFDIQKWFLYNTGQPGYTVYIDEIDKDKVIEDFNQQFGFLIENVHEKRCFNYDKSKIEPIQIVWELKNGCFAEAFRDEFRIVVDNLHIIWANNLILEYTKYKENCREEPFELSLLVYSNGSYFLNSFALEKTSLDVEMYYNDDFLPVHNKIISELNKAKNKGLVLLHGLPGAGKTSYLRYLTSQVNKRIIFLTSEVAARITEPDFINVLVDYPNSVLIIEDAESLLMDRRATGNSSVANLLNITDGLLSDIVNVQIVATFNMSLNLIDPALMRKGRLLAMYEFGKLTVAKARNLCKYLEINRQPVEPCTLAELFIPEENGSTKVLKPKIGFMMQTHES